MWGQEIFYAIILSVVVLDVQRPTAGPRLSDVG